MFVKQELKYRMVDELCLVSAECEYISMHIEKTNICIVELYRVPNTSIDIFHRNLEHIVEFCKNKHWKLIIGMDMNIDLLKSEMHTQTAKTLDLLLSNFLIPMITIPT